MSPPSKEAAPVSSSRGVAVVFSALFTLALLFSASSLAVDKTTGPGSRLDLYVIITDQKISLDLFALSDYAGANELYEEPLQDVKRGDVALVVVENRGKKPHNFVLLGEKTALIKPGGKARFTVSLLERGSFPYSASTSGTTKDLKGKLTVY
jgi:hypothetical protein